MNLRLYHGEHLHWSREIQRLGVIQRRLNILDGIPTGDLRGCIIIRANDAGVADLQKMKNDVRIYKDVDEVMERKEASEALLKTMACIAK